MAARNGPPDRVAGLLATVLQRVDPDRQLRAYAAWGCWDEEVGAAIAQRAQPARFRNGILFVTVANHTWMQELQFMKEEIRAKLNLRLGEVDPPLIRDIYFVSGTVPKPAAPAKVSPPPPPPIAEPDAPVAALPSSGDARVDEAFARVMRARARRLARDPSLRNR